jgi:ketosteroid isomerase-like protein
MSERGGKSNRELLDTLFDVLESGEVDKLDDIMAPDVVSEYPQSGERLVGLENIKAMIANYPGGVLTTDRRHMVIIGGEERYILTPTFNMVRVEGSGDTLVSATRARYPDGSDWFVITFTQFRDGRISHAEMYFAPFFEAPEWRAQWVERFEHKD